jgi:hypothetical protein
MKADGMSKEDKLVVANNGFWNRIKALFNHIEKQKQATDKYLADEPNTPRLDVSMLLLDAAIEHMKKLIKEQRNGTEITSNVHWATKQLESIARQISMNQDENKQSIVKITDEILAQMRAILTPADVSDDASTPTKFDPTKSASAALPQIEECMKRLGEQLRLNTERLMSTHECGGLVMDKLLKQ